MLTSNPPRVFFHDAGDSQLMIRWLSRLRALAVPVTALSLSLFCLTLLASTAKGQTDELGDGSADPVKLFERGQNAHAHGEFAIAVDFYQQALKLKPEFPEAQFQLGSALVSLNRLPEAEAAFKHAIEQRKDWSLPYASLGALLARDKRQSEAEPFLVQALKLEPGNLLALRTLSDLRFRAGNAKEAAELAKRATLQPDAPASTWVIYAMAERALGNKAEARTSLDRALQLEPTNVAALMERADESTADGNFEAAIADLKAAEKAKPNDRFILSHLFDVYQRSGNTTEAARLAQTLGLSQTNQQQSSSSSEIKVVGTPAEIEAANDPDPAKARLALEKLLEKNPRNAMLLAKLGASYRTDDPKRSLEFYGRANELDPKNADYAVGYSAALVQARQFAQAAQLLSQVIAAEPNNYPAHANFATALYELKRFPEAIPQYRWLLAAKPDLSVAYYFIATAHDKMGELEEALAAYQEFIAKAQPELNQLEIEKVKLRLPSLQRQIKLGQGVKKKP